MSDERPTDQSAHADSTTTVPPTAAAADAGTDAATNRRPDDAACRETSDSQDNLQTRILSTDQARQFAAYRYRQFFAQAQEQFTAGEFVEANRTLKEIPEDFRTADIERLALLVTARIREVAELRSGIQTALNAGKQRRLIPRLMRLLELQPGDEWANTIRHRLEDEEAVPPTAVKPIVEKPTKSLTERPMLKTLAELPNDAAAPRPIMKTVQEVPKEIGSPRPIMKTLQEVPKEIAAPRPIMKTVQEVPREIGTARPIMKTVQDVPKEIGSPRPVTKTLVELPAGFLEPLIIPDEPPPSKPAEPERPLRRPAAKASSGTAAIEIIDDDAEVDEVWEFGERLVKSGPPPLKPHMTRPQSVRVKPASSEDDDLVGWLEPEPPHSLMGMWIAIAVSGVVVLLALIATIVVLLVQKGT